MDYFKYFDVGVSVGLVGGGFNTGDPVFLLVFGLLAVLLEVWLSCRKSRRPGLLLPAASFLWALGSFLMCYDAALAQLLERLGITAAMVLLVFLRNNLLTLLLLAVYAVCRWIRRRRRRRTRELDRTRVEDL
ncbi:hypothetical protein [uncultured Dysosmobacter sp.]|uniref:hypothetical protein n=1 Tax=uncultured Dysosmobacter sp. TaxID=2591384 RepID=UPI0026175534|nr:hypothetical protein [uncultured Dysosmobacter sp.]